MKLTKKDIKQIEKWIEALRSGKYSQTIRELQNETGYCCLGVACKVIIPITHQELNENKTLVGGFPTAQRHSPNWLKDINNDVNDKLGKSLSSLNDNYGVTFNEIADIIELVYIHKAI